jgi:hypothetical protein
MSNYTPKVAKMAAPHLRPGEVVEIGASTSVGTVSVKRQLITATVVAVASAGMVYATVRPAHRYLAVTNQRLMFFTGRKNNTRSGKLLFSIPRDAVAVIKAGRHLLYHRMELAIAGQEKGLLINFPTGGRATMEQVAALFPAAGTVAPPPQAAQHAYQNGVGTPQQPTQGGHAQNWPSQQRDQRGPVQNW